MALGLQVLREFSLTLDEVSPLQFGQQAFDLVTTPTGYKLQPLVADEGLNPVLQFTKMRSRL